MTNEACSGNNASPSASTDPSKFQPSNRTNTTPDIDLPHELWLTVVGSPCSFGPNIFDQVMLNLIKNPNVTSSHLFRADIFYDSSKDPRVSTLTLPSDRLGSHLKVEYRPTPMDVPGWHFDKVIVRQLIPRNVQLDRPLIQTCTYLSRRNEHNATDTLVVFTPHVDSAEDMPFYHPKVEKLAFYHSCQPKPSPLGPAPPGGKISVSYKPFPEATSEAVSNKLDRTALRLLQTLHKHGQGQQAGYEKRVHHDQVIPQQRYQDTYTRLKTKYGRKLCEGWVETTDPSKHVFEDLGIAAFLLELWVDMYEMPITGNNESTSGEATTAGAEFIEYPEDLKPAAEQLHVEDSPNSATDAGDRVKPSFPGFVDIGCGNGLLVYILISEGYRGFGFDARERKTWSTFPTNVRKNLSQRVLVPEVLRSCEEERSQQGHTWHNGVFSEFVISNHADELTAWTPLLAYLNNTAFIAIPCCSHDLTGSRFRAPEFTKALKPGKRSDQAHEHPARLPQQESQSNGSNNGSLDEGNDSLHLTQAAETGSLKRSLVQKKMASAYTTLCSYVTSLATTVGFEPEQEVLRIPSTRNQSIIGRLRTEDSEPYDVRRNKIRQLVEEELNKSIEQIGKEWVERAEQLARKPSSGH